MSAQPVGQAAPVLCQGELGLRKGLVPDALLSSLGTAPWPFTHVFGSFALWI